MIPDLLEKIVQAITFWWPKRGRDRPKARPNGTTEALPTDSSQKQAWSRRERITRRPS